VKGDWENWIRFFLTGIHETATQAVQTAKRLMDLFKKDRQRIQKLGLAAGSVLRAHHFLQAHPITSISKASDALDLSFQTVKTALNRMQKLGIVREISGRQRNQLFAYEPHLKILSEGTEPLK
jgi:Fic family protein